MPTKDKKEKKAKALKKEKKVKDVKVKKAKSLKKEKKTILIDDEEDEEIIEEENIDEEEIDESDPFFKYKTCLKEHFKVYDSMISKLDKDIDNMSRNKVKGVKKLKSVRKNLVKMRKQVIPLVKSYRKRSRPDQINGFNTEYNISKELAEFLNVEEDSKFTRTDITRAICAYTHINKDEARSETLKWDYLNHENERDLRDSENKRVINPDKALSKLLKYDQFKKDVKKGNIVIKAKDKKTGLKYPLTLENDKLQYYTIQMLITPHLKKIE
jgi:hypothetical protein